MKKYFEQKAQMGWDASQYETKLFEKLGRDQLKFSKFAYVEFV
jgi:hypothetical protein